MEEDSIFDPWSIEPSEVGRSSQPVRRWRSAPAPNRPEPPPPPRDGGAPSSRPKARLRGTAGYLRTMVVPRLEDAASRIRLHRHEASVEDLLTGSPPLVRLRMTPVSGPLDEAGPARTATLEIRLGEPFNGTVAIVREIDSEGGAWRDEERMPIETLSAAALRGLVFDFVDLGLQAP